jgi:predicted RNA binding protein YcfA (HicA-like mRNA interferase family)
MDLSVLLNEEITESQLIELIDEMKITAMKRRDVHKFLSDKGWGVVRQDGDHYIYGHPQAKHTIPIPKHNDVSIGVVRKTVQQSDPNWTLHLNSVEMRPNIRRIIKETIKSAVDRRKLKKKETEDTDKFIPNPELKSEITKD